MRFGKVLEEGIVPEWSGQYIDYGGGKKLIKKLRKDKQPPLSERLRAGRTPTVTGSAGGAAAGPGANGADTYEELELPSPALNFANTPGAAAAARRASLGPTPDLAPLHERSPLVTGSAPRGSYTEDMSAPILMTRLDRQKAGDFFAWLQKELTRVNKFYEDQERQVTENFRHLEEQLAIMAEHKRFSKARQPARPGVPGVKRAYKFLDRIELPQLPLYFRRALSRHSDGGSDGDGSDNEPHSPGHGFDVRGPRDFVRVPYTYYQAKHMLKVALFQLYEYVQQLKGYQALNETALRKITKKFDKAFQGAAGARFAQAAHKDLLMLSSHVLEDLTRRIEQDLASYYLDGNHKNAVQRLQASKTQHAHNFSVLMVGLALGAGLPLFIRGIVKAVKLLNTPGHGTETKYLLQIWNGFFFISLIMLLFSLNILVWHKYRVSYPFIFDLSRIDAIDYRQFAVMPSIQFFVFALLGWLSFEVPDSALPGRYFPCIFLGLTLGTLLLPAPTLFWAARRWLVTGMARLFLSGLYPVEFRDFFLGDIFCSLVFSTSNIEFFFCVYATKGWWLPGSAVDRCTSSQSHLLGFFQCLPGIWRLLQCLRRYFDTLDWFPHLLNAGKYAVMVLFYMLLSLARINKDSVRFHVLFIVFGVINAIYASLWDVFMDFSLGPNLRKVLIYPRWTYYFIMVIDPIMRFTWVLYIIFWNERQQAETISFIVALVEIIRRFLWIFFRVENEHAANVLMYRASKDLELPYATGGVKDVSDDEEEASEEDDHSEGRPSSMRKPPPGSGGTGIDVATPLSRPGGRTPGMPGRRSSLVPGSAPQTPASLGRFRSVLERAHTADFTRRRRTSADDHTDEEDNDGDDE